MDHFEFDKQFQTGSNSDDGYYHEYCRLYLANVALTTQVRELIEEKHALMNQLSKYESQDFVSSGERGNEKNKRMRRNADQIQRYYKCMNKSCGKSYGSEGSLNQHYKLKHPEVYVTLPNVQGNYSHSTHSISEEEERRDKDRNKENRVRKDHKNK